MKRERFIDIAKGIGILLVMYGHCSLIDEFDFIKKMIYGFHMPLFFMISGYLLYKKGNNVKLFHVLKKYVCYYVFFTVLNQLAQIGKDVIRGTINLQNIIPDFLDSLFLKNNYGALWFIVTLLLVEILVGLIFKLKNKKISYAIVSLTLIISLLFYNYFYLNNILIICWLIIGMLFFMIGNCFGMVKQNIRFSTGLSISSLLIYAIATIFNSRIDIATGKTGNFFLFIVSSLFGTIALIQFCKIISQKENKIVSILELFGRNSIILYGTHHFIIQIVRSIFLIISINMYLRNFLVFLITIISEYYILNIYLKQKNHKKVRKGNI